jgi:hypothetical protein
MGIHSPNKAKTEKEERSPSSRAKQPRQQNWAE